ncbi:LysM peptidoglycan-binding domain-containing protein [Vibrio sp. D431a]|uniref:LysM peptidoglycan-binding domain-containing protein n=1 Tax=Vibrio sp. D431a TaxID=2837388 RepID=UPI002553510E|nr:LysM domain-containing protein [Vibrio sp. D431a]MDK9790165.1 LysM peptidoglycan-binding domain-containing protein [Vibrio sp. D431a]
MSVNLRNKHNYKYLMLREVVKEKGLFQEFSESLVDKFKAQSKTEDFGDYVGFFAFKGDKLETFLRENGRWDELDQKCKSLISSEHLENLVISEDPSFKSLRWKNKTQANDRRIEKAAYLAVTPLTRALMKLRQKPEGKMNTSAQRALVEALGYSKLSSGAWVPIARGMDRALMKPVGGKINQVVKNGGVIEMAAEVSGAVEKVAKRHALPLAEPLKAALLKVKEGVKAAAMCAVIAFSTGADLVDSNFVDYSTKLGSSFMSIETGASDLSSLGSGFEVIYGHELSQGYSADLTDSDLTQIDSDLVDDYRVNVDLPSFSEKLKNEVVKHPATQYTVKTGDNMWTLAEQVTQDLVSGFDVLIDDSGNPSESTVLVNEIHKMMIEANNLDNPDLIFEGQKIEVGSEIAKLLNDSIDERINFVAENLRPTQTPSLKMSI